MELGLERGRYGTQYVGESTYIGSNDVVFLDNKTGRKLVRRFESPYLAKQFMNSVSRSKRTTLVSYPIGF